jgi:lactobin A/cerein 7B family class IIb bacteriocin
MKQLSKNQIDNVHGGFVPLVILGLSLSSAQTAGAIGAMFVAGFAVGTAAASE